MDFGGYLYQGENINECVSAEKCLSKEGWYPYSDPGECLKIEPTFDGDFIKRVDDIYSCIRYSLSKST